MKPKNFLDAMNCAAEGIIHALKKELHLKVHFIIFIFVVLMSLFFNLSLSDFCFVIILSAIVIMAELFNTAMEYTMNILTKDFHIEVKYVKDIAAGAVLFVSFLAFFLGILIFSKYLIVQSDFIGQNVLFLAIVSLLLTVIAVIFFKAFLKTGRPFRGGMPSGHSAVSFSIWISIYMATSNIYIIFTSFIAATIISFSRYYLRIHKKQEVLYGAILGAGITFLIFSLFYK